MARSMQQCKDIRKRLEEAIADEAKAGPDYQALATDIHEMFCGGKCVKGFLAKLNLQGIAMDEDKHKALIEQILAAVNEDCEETSRKQGLLGPAPKEEEGIFGIKMQE